MAWTYDILNKFFIVSGLFELYHLLKIKGKL